MICWGNLAPFHPGISAGRSSLSPSFIKLPVQLMLLFFTDSSRRCPSSLSFIRVSRIPLAGHYCMCRRRNSWKGPWKWSIWVHYSPQRSYAMVYVINTQKCKQRWSYCSGIPVVFILPGLLWLYIGEFWYYKLNRHPQDSFCQVLKQRYPKCCDYNTFQCWSRHEMEIHSICF